MDVLVGCACEATFLNQFRFQTGAGTFYMVAPEAHCSLWRLEFRGH